MRHKSKNKTRPLFTLSLEMARLVNETRLLLVPSVNLGAHRPTVSKYSISAPQGLLQVIVKHIHYITRP